MYFLMMPIYMIILITMEFTKRSITKLNGRLLLGVTVPTDCMEDDKVIGIVNHFKKEYGIMELGVMVAAAASVFLSGYPIIMSLSALIWTFVSLGLMEWVIIRGFDALYQYKKEQHWVVDGSYVIQVDTEVARLKSQFACPAWHWILIVAITVAGSCLYALKADAQMIDYVYAITNGVTTLSILTCYCIMKRMKSTVYSSRTEVNVALNHNFCHETTKAFVLSGYASALCYLVGGVFSGKDEHYIFAIGVAAGSAICVLFFLVMAMVRIRQKRTLFSWDETFDQGIDEDVYWRGGLYNNPNDPKLFVEKRIGLGVQLNDARPAAKAIYIGSAALVLGIMIWIATMIPLDFPKLHLQLEDSMISIDATNYHKEIDLEQVNRAELIQELPRMYKNYGYFGKSYAFGEFRVKEIGHCSVYINDSKKAYLVLYAGDKIYLINSDDDDEFQSCIRAVEQRVTIENK